MIIHKHIDPAYAYKINFAKKVGLPTEKFTESSYAPPFNHHGMLGYVNPAPLFIGIYDVAFGKIRSS